MAPLTAEHVEEQTVDIVFCLLDDDAAAALKFRHFDPHVETDSHDSPEDNFDPVLIAEKLRSVADALNDDPKFKAALTDLKEAVAHEAVEAAFSRGVDVLCQTHVAQRAEVAPEMQIIRASVALGLYLKKSSPDLKSSIQRVMTAFLTRRVGKWVTQQGGWDKVI